jgi:hypothetical protein
MHDTGAETIVPYAQFVARRNRRLRIMAELRSQLLMYSQIPEHTTRSIVSPPKSSYVASRSAT